MKQKKLTLIMTVLFALAVLFSACAETSEGQEMTETASTQQTPTEAPTEAPTEEPTQPEDEELTFGSTFSFDGFEITIGDSYTFMTIDNQFSDKNGAEVIEIPVTLTNKSGETGNLNMFYYEFFGSQGVKLDIVGSYFDEDAAFSGDMRDGATKQTYFHMLYDGDGDYYIEFDNYSEEFEVKLPIAK